jgi:hypothetical protein
MGQKQLLLQAAAWLAPCATLFVHKVQLHLEGISQCLFCMAAASWLATAAAFVVWLLGASILLLLVVCCGPAIETNVTTRMALHQVMRCRTSLQAVFHSADVYGMYPCARARALCTTCCCTLCWCCWLLALRWLRCNSVAWDGCWIPVAVVLLCFGCALHCSPLNSATGLILQCLGKLSLFCGVGFRGYCSLSSCGWLHVPIHSCVWLFGCSKLYAGPVQGTCCLCQLCRFLIAATFPAGAISAQGWQDKGELGKALVSNPLLCKSCLWLDSNALLLFTWFEQLCGSATMQLRALCINGHAYVVGSGV